MNVNYAPLQQDPTPQQLTSFRAMSDRAVYFADVRPKYSYVFVMVISSIIGFIIGLMPGVVIGVATEQVSFIWLTGIVTAAAAACGAMIVCRRREARMMRYGCKLFLFLQANPQFVYRPVSVAESKGAIFSQQQPSGFALEPTDGSYRVGNHQYEVIVRRGDSHKTITYKWGYLAIKLNRKLPHMLLDAKSNNLSWMQQMIQDKEAGLSANFSKDQILSLEGDFNNYFTLFAPREYERDALYVFTPDLMSLLVDSAQTFDVEIVDDYLYFYVRDGIDMTDSAVMNRLFSLVEAITTKALRQTDNYTDETVGNSAVNIVADQGRRLQGRRWDLVTGGTFVVAVIIWLWKLVAS